MIASGVYKELCQTSRMDLLEQIVDSFELLTILAITSILDVWQGSEYVSESVLIQTVQA